MQITPILNDNIILAQSSNTANSYPDTDRTHVASTSQLVGAASNQTTVAIEDAPLETAEHVHMQDLKCNSYIGTGKSKSIETFCRFNISSCPKKHNLNIRSESEDSNSSSQDWDLSS